MLAVAVVGKGFDADAAARVEQADELQVLGIHQLEQSLHDDVDAILMKIAVIAKTEQVQLQTLALDHAHARDVINDDAAKVGLARLGTQRGELRTVQRHHIFVLGMLVLKGLQNIRSVIKLVGRALVTQQRHALKFLLISWHKNQLFNSFFGPQNY